jgi:hypothetical protein
MLEPEDSVFTAIEEETKQDQIEEETRLPKYYEEGWHDYVMSKFLPDELMDGHPTCDGLRRVTEQIVGPITDRQITHLIPLKSFSENETAAVAVRIKVSPRDYSTFERLDLVEESIADVNNKNTPDLKFLIHPLATCETRAEARALRKILRLRKVIAAEELADESKLNDLVMWNPEDQISEEQINALDIICRRLDISVFDYINCGSKKYKKVEEITKSKAAEILNFLNKIQRNAVEKPKNVPSYIMNWRN